MKMEEWTVEEKKKILEILYKYGAGDYNLIHQYMPEKTVGEIQIFCEKYIQISMDKWERSKANKDSDAALKNWLLIMKRVNAAQTGSLTDIVPRVLKYIALFEKRKQSCINLNDSYMVLSDISVGLAAKKIDERNAYFFHECLLKLAKSVKHGSGPSIKYAKYLTNLKVFMNKESKKIQQKSEDRVLNPLNVPKNLLKMSTTEKCMEVFD